jgi:hypothetical protein
MAAIDIGDKANVIAKLETLLEDLKSYKENDRPKRLDLLRQAKVLVQDIEEPVENMTKRGYVEVSWKLSDSRLITGLIAIAHNQIYTLDCLDFSIANPRAMGSLLRDSEGGYHHSKRSCSRDWQIRAGHQ